MDIWDEVVFWIRGYGNEEEKKLLRPREEVAVPCGRKWRRTMLDSQSQPVRVKSVDFVALS